MREQITECISAGKTDAAVALAQRYWRENSGPLGRPSAAAAFLVSQFEGLRGKIPLTPYRLAILRSFTVEPVIPILRALGFLAGLDLSVYVAEFGTYVQEILQPRGPLYEFQPQAVILAVETRAIAPKLWEGVGNQSEFAAQAVADFGSWVAAFRRSSQAHLIVHGLEQAPLPAAGLLDVQTDSGQRSAIESVNSQLRAIAGAHTGVWILDYDALVARAGRRAWHDDRKWLTVRLPLAAPFLPDLAREWMRYLHPLSGKVAKAVVVDLDNTLWGGVIGEDGMDGIRVNGEYPGAAYQALQRVLLHLANRGILLAVASKNNPEDAMEVIEKHPGMILRAQNFSAFQIHWGEKAQSLSAIAEELNIGRDSLVFVDDNPVEREQVRAAAPEVHVLELPDDPLGFARAVAECPLFERLEVSSEDRKRSQYYQEQRERATLERTASSREDFYRSLEQKAEVAPVSTGTRARTAQLTQKTNQFNLTTRRYTEQEIAAMAASPDWSVWTLKVSDRFADNGLVGVAILRHAGEAAEIDTLLMSCRVIGRTVETAFLAKLLRQAEARGARRLEGWFLPTKKNPPAANFYREHGFVLAEETSSGSRWSLDLLQNQVACPEWIEMIEGSADASGGA